MTDKSRVLDMFLSKTLLLFIYILLWFFSSAANGRESDMKFLKIYSSLVISVLHQSVRQCDDAEE